MDLNWQIISSKSKKRILKLTALILTAALFLTGVTPSFAEKSKEADLDPSAEISWDDAPAIEATSAILVDAGSGEILYEKNAYEKRDPASITKMLTCLVVLETMELDDKVTVTQDVSNSGTSINIKEGEVFTVEQLLYALMLPSANDAAVVLAVAAGGSIDNFCDMMNERAERCGATDTHFTNPSGLNEPLQPNHRTTAYDLALIAMEAMKNKTFRKIVSTVDYTIPKTNKSKERNIVNVNRCLSDGQSKFPQPEYIKNPGAYRYEGTLGIKTGYTSVAGNCFCGWAQKDDTDLIAVVLNSSSYESRFEDTIALWDYGFSKYYTYTPMEAVKDIVDIPVKRGAKGHVNASVVEDLDITLNKEYKKKGITTETIVDEKPVAPVKKGDTVGTIVVYKDGTPVAEAELVAMADVEKGGLLSYIGIPDEDVPKFLIWLAVLAVTVLAVTKLYRQSKHRKKLRKKARINRNVRRKEWEKEKNPFD